MSEQRQTIAKNASVMLVSQVVTWSLTLVFSIVLRRFLGPEGSGHIVIANSIWLIIGVFIGFGMDMFLTKEIARNPKRAADLLGTSYAIRTGFYIVGIAIVLAYSQWIGYSTETMILIQVVGVAALFNQLAGASRAALQGFETMEYISLGEISSKVVNMLLGIGVLLMGWRELAIAWVMVAAALVMFVLQTFFLIRRHRLRTQVDPAMMRPMLLSSLPYMATVFGMIAYSELSVLTISMQVSVMEVGWYGAAMQIFGTMLFGTVVFSTVTFPAMARSHIENPARMPEVLRQNLALILLLSVPIGFGLMSIAQPLMLLLFGPEFAPSGQILQVLGLVLIFMYLNVLFGQYFNSIDRQHVWTAVVIISAVMIVPLNLLLVPWGSATFGLGALGGAVSLLMTQVGQFLAGWLLAPKGTLNLASIRQMVLVFLAGMLMALSVWPFRDLLLIVPILVGALSYPLVIFLFRVISPEQKALLREVLQSVRTKLQRKRAVPPVAASPEAPGKGL
ncbi:MAG: flippase [Oscillochloridaceae bacterium umkhey_bin13]